MFLFTLPTDLLPSRFAALMTAGSVNEQGSTHDGIPPGAMTS